MRCYSSRKRKIILSKNKKVQHSVSVGLLVMLKRIEFSFMRLAFDFLNLPMSNAHPKSL